MTIFKYMLANLMAVTFLMELAGCSSAKLAPEDPMPVFATDMRILFTGDSITDGNRGRNTNLNHLLGHGYQFIIACKYGGELLERKLTL